MLSLSFFLLSFKKRGRQAYLISKGQFSTPLIQPGKEVGQEVSSRVALERFQAREEMPSVTLHSESVRSNGRKQGKAGFELFSSN